MRAAGSGGLWLLTAMLLLAVPGVAAPEDQEGADLETRERQARELIDLSGVYRSMDYWPSMAVSAAGPFRARATPEVFLALEATLQEGYNSAVGREILVQEFSENFNPTAADPVRWWFESALGRRVEQLELAAGSPEGGRLMEAYSRRLAVVPLEPERREAAERYNNATRRSEALARTLYVMNESILRALNGVAPESQQIPPEQVEAQLAKLKVRLPELFRGFVITQLAYIQKDLTPEERIELVKFSESDAAQWLYRTYMKGLDRALANGSRRALEAFRERLAKQSD